RCVLKPLVTRMRHLRFSGAIMTEQRRSTRYTSQRAIGCRPVAGVRDMNWAATICDVSLGGIGVTASRRFEHGTLLVIEAEGGGEDGFLKVVQVRHVRSEDQRRCFLGCAFVSELSADELAAIR